MKLYKYIVLGVVAISFCSCDNKEDFLNELNSSPSITITGKNSATVQDSVKVSVKSSEPNVSYQINIDDVEGNVEKVTFKTITGDITVNHNGDDITGELPFSSGTQTLTLTPNELGTNVMEFTVVDEQEEKSSLTVELVAFQNLAPVANFKIENISTTAIPNHYRFNAASSYDRDQHLGGGISKYRFVIDNQPYETTVDNFAKYSFGESGTYTITLEVQDSDGEWSSEFSDQVIID